MSSGDEFMFFGTKSEYRAMIEKGQLEDTKKEDQREKRSKETRTTPAVNISADDGETISEETLRMLKRTRHLHDTRTVYMQSDISFYDSFYVRNDDSVIDDPELEKEARLIRRVYKDYPRYLHALYIRDLYVDKIVEKIGSEEIFDIIQMSGGIRYWMPPVPIYSKKSEDYEEGIGGVIDSSNLMEWDDDLLLQILDELLEEKGISSADDIEVVGGVLTDNLSIVHSDLVYNDSDSRGTGKTSVNLSDLQQLQKIFHGWYQDDSAKDSKTAAVNNSLEDKAFRRTPEKIREAYYWSKVKDFSKEFKNVKNGVPNEPEYDPNEMVYDPVSGKPMSRKEYEARCTVRILKDAGWTETLRIMKLMDVGSSREYSMMKRNNKKKKRSANKVAGTSLKSEDIYGEAFIPTDNPYLTDLDSLKAQMFSD